MAESPPPLHGKVAIVTAASREIGAAISERLALDGAAVLMAHYGETALAEQHAARIRAQGGDVAVFEVDLSRPAGNAALVQRCVEQFGRLDFLVANAGITRYASMLESDEALWDLLMNTNLKSAYFGAQAAAQRMIAQGWGGRIVFSSSVAGMRGFPELSIYSITKAALQQMARTIAAELAAHRITVNAVGIGAVLNARNLETDPHYESRWAHINPLGRVLYPSDIAGAVRFLLSDDAAMITGHTLVVDGGFLLK